LTETKESKSFPFIEGEKINLCAANLDHVDLYCAWMNHPETRKYARHPFPQTIEEVKKIFEPQKEQIKRDIFFEVWHKEEKKPIGFTGFIHIQWFTRNALIWYTIGDPEYLEQGIATEATKLLVNYGFTELNFHKITAVVLAPNKASIRVAEEVGFKHEITIKKEEYIDGEFVDNLSYVIFKEEWMKTE